MSPRSLDAGIIGDHLEFPGCRASISRTPVVAGESAGADNPALVTFLTNGWRDACEQLGEARAENEKLRRELNALRDAFIEGELVWTLN